MNTPAVSFSRIWLPVAALLAASGLRAADIAKANNTTALNDSGSWTGGVVPGAADNAVWGSAVTATGSAALGADTAWNGIRLSGAVGIQTISNASSANTLTLGAGGIDYAGAAAGTTDTTGSALFIQSKVLLSSDQTWNVTETP